ncbi:ABC transporter ATP-binding protein [Nocardioides sp. Bht2]|uniref:ABC transporter ATP-binding protein n=1 Tax=Nocardioides sp. Bht2 TaxID=3392297 RepID=UPI0039B56E40
MTASPLPDDAHPAPLAGHDLVLGYAGKTVVHGASLDLVAGQVTALVGPNGSGKSTLLRALARLHPIGSGAVSVAGTELRSLRARDFARRVALLSQSRPHPSGLTVHDVVGFGRHPHRPRFGALNDADRDAITSALEITGTSHMVDRPVDQLSGGELQRVWLASSLAQETGVLLLDEPTNHLDLRYQVETLRLVRRLAERGTTLGVVLHDLNHAAAVADRVVLLHRGEIHADGAPAAVLTSAHLSEVYGIPIETTVSTATGHLHVEALASTRLRP